MKRSPVLAVSVVALIILSAVPIQQSMAQGSFTEKLNVFVAGTNAYWFMTFTGVNGTARLAPLESSPGLTWYNVTAVDTSGWKPDFQVFGPQGYNLVPVPFIPSAGLFLKVGSDSFTDALAAAHNLDSYTLSSFVSLSNGTGEFTFYSPLAFDNIVPSTLLKLLPSSAGGFADAVSSSALLASSSPLVLLEGVKSSSGFDHTLVVGSMTNKALDSEERPEVFGYFGTSATSLAASSKSTSSSIQVRSLDGLVESRDAAAIISNDTSRFSGSYSLSLAPGQRVYLLNATIVQQPVSLLATTLVDNGVLQHGDNVSISVSLTNLANSSAVTKVSGGGPWWDQATFKLVRGNASISFSSIAPAGTQTPTYVLQYIGTTPGEVTVPSVSVKYSYAVGLSKVTGVARTNPIVLSLGSPHAVLMAYAAPTGGFGKSVGSTQNLKVTLQNVGTQTASNITVAGQHVSGIPPGNTASVTVPLTASGLLGTNMTKAYAVGYTDLEGAPLVATANPVHVLFSHTSIKTGYAQLVLDALLIPLKGGGLNLTLAFRTTNLGLSNVTSFSAHTTLPAGLGCGTLTGTGAVCSSGSLTLEYASIGAGATKSAYQKFNVTTPVNYFLPPVVFTGASAGVDLSGRSNGFSVPSGVVLSKSFSPFALFAGMASSVSIMAFNSGPFTLYNASVTSTADSFDALAASAVPSASSRAVPPGANLSAAYGVTTSSADSGNLSASQVSSRFFFGGNVFSLGKPGPAVSIYRPLYASITTSPPSPVEGKSFSILIGIVNPSGVDVTNVLFTLPVPSGLSLSGLVNAQLSGGLLTVSVSSLQAHGVYNASATAVASSGVTAPFAKARLTFGYGGATVGGKLPGEGIAIAENVTTRYIIPTALVFLALLATAYYMRRKGLTTVPASQK